MASVTWLITAWLWRSPQRDRRLSLIQLWPVVFLATFFFRQLFVRDGWLIMGRAGTGLFGRPDLETLAQAGSFTLCILLLTSELGKDPSRSIPSKLLQAASISIASSMVFFAISLLHRHLQLAGTIADGDFFIASSILNLRFPHPERLPLVAFMTFVQSFLTLTFVGERKGRPMPKHLAGTP